MALQAMKRLVMGHPYDDLMEKIPHLIDRVNEFPDDRQAARDLKEIAVEALDQYPKIAGPYQHWVDTKVDDRRRRELYNVVLKILKFIQRASDTPKNQRKSMPTAKFPVGGGAGGEIT